MTIYTAANIRETFLEQCHTRQGMELNLEYVTEMDITGVQLLLAFRIHLDSTASGLQLKNSSEAVQEALKLTHLTETFETDVGVVVV